MTPDLSLCLVKIGRDKEKEKHEDNRRNELKK